MGTSTSSLPVCRFQHTRIRPEPLLDNKDNGTPTPRKAPLSDCGTLYFGLHVTLVIDSTAIKRLAETVCVAPNQQVIDLRVQRKVRSTLLPPYQSHVWCPRPCHTLRPKPKFAGTSPMLCVYVILASGKDDVPTFLITSLSYTSLAI